MNAGFFILTSNPQLVHGNMERWKVVGVVHITATARVDSGLDGELRSSSSKNSLNPSLRTFLKVARRSNISNTMELDNSLKVKWMRSVTVQG